MSLDLPEQQFKNRETPLPERLSALLTLVDSYQPGYFDVLFTAMTDTAEHPQIRSSVALSLGKLLNTSVYQAVLDEREPQVLESLIYLAQHDEDETIRAYAITALGMSEREEVIPTVVGALKDPDLKVFHNAAEALSHFDRLVIPHLLEQLNIGADDAKCVAAWKLGELGHPDAIPALLPLAKYGVSQEDSASSNEQTSTEVQALAIWALGEIGYRRPGVTEVLQEALNHPEPEIHERAKLALKKVARNVN